MANCAKCGTTISVQDIVAGKFRKLEGKSYCVNCAPALAPAAAPAPAASARPAAPAKPAGVTKPAGITKPATPMAKPAAPAAKPASSVKPAAKATSGPSASSSRISRVNGDAKASSSASTRRSVAPPRDDGDGGGDEGEEERPRGYVKQEDPTLKIAAIVAGVLLLGGGGFFVYAKLTKGREEQARIDAKSKSDKALHEITEFVKSHPNDEDIDATDAYIKERAPALNEIASSAVDSIRVELTGRRELAEKTREFKANMADIVANVDKAERAEDIRKKIDRTENLMSAMGSRVSDAEKKDFAALKVRNTVAVLKSFKERADAIRDKDPNDYAAITRAYTEAEEMVSDAGQQLIKSGVPGAAEAKELMITVRDATNDAAERWADSEKIGFVKMPLRDLLDSKEFNKQGSDEKAHWLPSPLADFKLENGVLTAKGLNKVADPNSKTIRAGILFWAPDSKTPMRNYEVTLRFKVLKKGFTLLARKGSGFMNHSYGFETAHAQDETKAANAAAQQHNAAQGAGGNAFDPMQSPADQGRQISDNATAFSVDEGKRYEVIERVQGKRIKIQVKPLDGGDLPDPLEDNTNARSGGFGIQLLPGAEVQFEQIGVKILN